MVTFMLHVSLLFAGAQLCAMDQAAITKRELREASVWLAAQSQMNFIAETAHTRCSATKGMSKATDTGIIFQSGATGIKMLRSPWGSIEVEDNHAKIRGHIVFEHGKLELDGDAVVECDGISCKAQNSLIVELDEAQQIARAERYALLEEALTVAVYEKLKDEWERTMHSGMGTYPDYSLEESDSGVRTDKGLALFVSSAGLALRSSFGKQLSLFVNRVEPVADFVDPDLYGKVKLAWAEEEEEKEGEDSLYCIVSACGLHLPVATTGDMPVGEQRGELNARLAEILALLPEDI